MKTVSSILIVDDNEGDLFLCKETISQVAKDRFPYIMTASNGEEALALFEDYESSKKEHPGRFPPIVILLDINMPRMDGFEFLEAFREVRARQNNKTSVVLMITSSSGERDRARAAEFSFVKKFLSKPATREEILDIAERFGEEV